MDLCSFLLKLLCLLTYAKMLAFGFVDVDERKCKYSRFEKLLRIRCYDMDLKEVPQYLKSSVEILDLSYNRIRKLKFSSFQKYTDIEYLMLYENMIQSVESGTFSHLTSLQEIDLSNNGLRTIPAELFQLPKLRNLYVDSNDLESLERDLATLEKPIRAPLEYLNIANCELHDIPDLGILPHLWQINASSNPLTDFSIARLANMCNLKVVALTKTQISQCSCQQINSHLSLINANKKFAPVCLDTLDENECPLPYNQTVGSQAFNICRASAAMEEAKSTWLFAVGCIGCAILVLLLVWYCVQRHRKQRAKKKLIRAVQNRKHFVISPKNAINNNSRHDDGLLRCDTA